MDNADPRTPLQRMMVQAVRDKAIEDYEKGWDVIVEAFTDDEIVELLGNARTPQGAINKVGEYVYLRKQIQKDVQAA